MICGQNLNMEGMLSQITSMKSKLLAGMDLDASVLKSQLIGDLSTLKSKVRCLCPAMPSIPSLSLQTEIANLLSMNINSSAFAGQLSSITSSFGSALTSAGKDLTSLLSGLSSTDICKSIPNMEIPSGSIYACFEESINEYSSHINNYNIWRPTFYRCHISQIISSICYKTKNTSHIKCIKQ